MGKSTKSKSSAKSKSKSNTNKLITDSLSSPLSEIGDDEDGNRTPTVECGGTLSSDPPSSGHRHHYSGTSEEGDLAADMAVETVEGDVRCHLPPADREDEIEEVNAAYKAGGGDSRVGSDDAASPGKKGEFFNGDKLRYVGKGHSEDCRNAIDGAPTHKMLPRRNLLKTSKDEVFEQAKLFVGGISWGTDEEMLREYFEDYGEVIQTVVMRDSFFGRSRGFGFVEFSESSNLEQILQVQHCIDGRMVKVNRAFSRDE